MCLAVDLAVWTVELDCQTMLAVVVGLAEASWEPEEFICVLMANRLHAAHLIVHYTLLFVETERLAMRTAQGRYCLSIFTPSTHSVYRIFILIKFYLC